MIDIQQQWEKLTVPELNCTLQALHQQMIQYQIQTEYSQAEIYRNYHENCKKYILHRNLQQAEQNYESNCAQSNKSRASELSICLRYWTEKFKEYNRECQQLFNSLEAKHQEQASALRKRMEEQLSTIVKQSNQLINLRKMEAHAAKQKNFVEAHSIQQKVKSLYDQERGEWMEAREKTILQNLKNLKSKQTKELEGTQNRIKLMLEDYEKEKFMNEQTINQKFDNQLKQLKANFERQILSLEGELRNLGGKSPSKKKEKEKPTRQHKAEAS